MRVELEERVSLPCWLLAPAGFNQGMLDLTSKPFVVVKRDAEQRESGEGESAFS